MSMRLDIDEVEKMKEELMRARNRSYSPYSKFRYAFEKCHTTSTNKICRVGCSLVTKDNTWFQGANVENASYGAGICAERTAIVGAVTAGYTKFKAIGIIGDSSKYITPCGICRQFIREFTSADMDMPIYMFNDDASEHVVKTIKELLPDSFGPEDLH